MPRGPEGDALQFSPGDDKAALSASGRDARAAHRDATRRGLKARDGWEVRGGARPACALRSARLAHAFPRSRRGRVFRAFLRSGLSSACPSTPMPSKSHQSMPDVDGHFAAKKIESTRRSDGSSGTIKTEAPMLQSSRTKTMFESLLPRNGRSAGVSRVISSVTRSSANSKG